MCGGNCGEYTHPDFLFCPRCCIAVRRRETIPANREQNYGDNWVEAHNKSRDVAIKADFMARLIRDTVPTGRVLDVGCASGVLVDRLSAMGYDADGVDWSRDAVSFATDHMRGRFMVGDAVSGIVDGEGIYDVIVASHVVEHLEDSESLLERANRLLKTNAYLFVATPNLSWHSPKPIWRGISSVFDTDHVACYSPDGLTKLLSKSGFDIVEIYTRTHGADLLTTICVALYNGIICKRSKPRRTNGSELSSGLLQRAYLYIVSLPVFRLIMRLPNRASEKNHRGMELIIVSKKGNRNTEGGA